MKLYLCFASLLLSYKTTPFWFLHVSCTFGLSCLLVEEEPQDPCNPSPCGSNSQCRPVNGHAVCSCMSGYIGAPPTCRPECVVSSDCPADKACVNQKCRDPCPGTCGLNARCQVANHNPICSCKAGFQGDPFVRCLPVVPCKAPFAFLLCRLVLGPHIQPSTSTVESLC